MKIKKVSFIVLFLLPICPCLFGQIGHFLSLEHAKTIGDLMGRNTVSRIGYFQEGQKGWGIGATAGIIYNLNGDEKKWSGLLTELGKTFHVAKKGEIGLSLFVGNEKNYWEVGAGLSGGLNTRIFKTDAFIKQLNFIDNGLHPYLVIGLNAKILIHYDNKNGTSNNRGDPHVLFD